MFILFFCFIIVLNIISFISSNPIESIRNNPFSYFYNQETSNLGFLRVISGFILIIITARMFGQEYNLGTIRILLARGIGRMQLVFSKLVAAGICAIILLLSDLIVNIFITFVMIQIAGNSRAFSSLTASFWDAVALYTLTALVSMGATILLTTAITVLGRSLAFGLTFSLLWFPADNVLITGIYLLANNTAGKNISAYLLGPNLNAMAGALTGREGEGLGALPLIPVYGTHTLLVAFIYMSIFTGVALVLIRKRDIRE
jgi:ABC-2 type transport system permease protein